MPVRTKTKEVETIEVRPSANMLNDVLIALHQIVTNPDALTRDRIDAGKMLGDIGRYGWDVDPFFATSTMYVGTDDE